MKKKQYLRYLYHLLFWVFIISFFTFIYGIRTGSYKTLFFILFGTLPIDILFTYFLIYLLIPEFLLNKKYASFILIFITSFSLVVFLEWTLNYFVIYPSVYTDFHKWKGNLSYFSGSALMIYISLGFVVLLASAIKLARFWLQSQQDKANLEIQSRKSELALLRSQVNPHFLFNTLNNIDALIRKDPDKASDSVMKLSEIMRYFIYEATTDKVSLDKEIQYLSSFIELQRIRYRDPGYISYQVTGNRGSLRIAPMLFIPFVENAFKHGVKSRTLPAILIRLSIEENKVRFEVINSIEKNIHHLTDPGRGIGLANVKRRLDLIYPDQYTLDIKESDEIFQINLVISLK